MKDNFMKINFLAIILLLLVGCNTPAKEAPKKESEMEKPTSHLRHVVLFQYKETSTPEDIANIIDVWSLDCMQASCDVSVINNGSFHKLVTIDGVTKAQLVDNKIS